MTRRIATLERVDLRTPYVIRPLCRLSHHRNHHGAPPLDCPPGGDRRVACPAMFIALMLMSAVGLLGVLVVIWAFLTF